MNYRQLYNPNAVRHTESDWVLECLHPRKLIWRLCQLLLAPSFLWVALQLLFLVSCDCFPIHAHCFRFIYCAGNHKLWTFSYTIWKLWCHDLGHFWLLALILSSWPGWCILNYERLLPQADLFVSKPFSICMFILPKTQLINIYVYVCTHIYICVYVRMFFWFLGDLWKWICVTPCLWTNSTFLSLSQGQL